MQFHQKSNSNGNRNNSGPATANGSTSNKMFDLKMCLLDFMRITTSNGTKQKKQQQQAANHSLRDTSTRYGPAYAQKMTDANVIYFNENMSMTSKCNTIKFSRCPTGNFKPNVMALGFSTTPAAAMPPPPLPPMLTNRNRSLRHWVGGKGALPTINKNPLIGIGTDSMSCFECSSSDERIASNTTKSSSSSTIDSPCSDSSLRDTETDEYVGNFSDYTGTQLGANSGNATALDSFCTLCTSSFSFNRCNRCEASSCSSKCNSTERNKKSKPQMTTTTDAGAGGAACIGSGDRDSPSGGCGVTSDYDSMQFRWVQLLSIFSAHWMSSTESKTIKSRISHKTKRESLNRNFFGWFYSSRMRLGVCVRVSQLFFHSKQCPKCLSAVN